MSSQAPNLNLAKQTEDLRLARLTLERLLNFRRPYDSSRDEFYRVSLAVYLADEGGVDLRIHGFQGSQRCRAAQ